MSIENDVICYLESHKGYACTKYSLVKDFVMHRDLFDTQKDFENALQIIRHTKTNVIVGTEGNND